MERESVFLFVNVDNKKNWIQKTKWKVKSLAELLKVRRSVHTVPYYIKDMSILRSFGVMQWWWRRSRNWGLPGLEDLWWSQWWWCPQHPSSSPLWVTAHLHLNWDPGRPKAFMTKGKNGWNFRKIRNSDLGKADLFLGELRS